MQLNKIRFYFSSDYRFQQQTLLALAVFGFVGHILFWLVLKFAVGYWESSAIRFTTSALFLSLLLLPRKANFKSIHIWYYELFYALVFPVLFAIFFIKNDQNAYWSASVLFAGVLYGFLTHPPKAIIIYPLSIVITIFVLKLTGVEVGNIGGIALVHFPAYFIVILIGVLQTMVRYANAKAETEFNRSETLLRNILPESIVERLKKSPSIIADKYDNTTVLFADVANFTPFAEKSSPEEVVAFLNEIFTRFDALIEKYHVEKIKTIGDAYMVVCGAPDANTRHAEIIASLALEMMTEASKIDRKNTDGVSIRMGIHSGPLVAGVIGNKKFAYDVWGDTVNTASRMESNGVPGKIQISEATYLLLNHNFVTSYRGEIDIKGKGSMKVYFLESVKHSL